MLEREIARKLLEVEDLPTLPAIMQRVLAVVESDRSSAQDLTKILEQDMAISARILRLANSAFYGLRFQVDSIRRAVVVVGFEAVRMLALATSVFDTLSKRRQFAFDPDEFWLHALGAAKAAQLLAEHLAPGAEVAERLFTSGLLHDIGKYCLALALGGEYRAAVEQSMAEKADLHTIEMARLETTHAHAGQWVAQKWRLPPAIVASIGFQFRPEVSPQEHRTEVAAVTLASDLARQAGFGVAGDYGPIQWRGQAVLGLTDDIRNQVLDELRNNKDEARRFLTILDNRDS